MIGDHVPGPDKYEYGLVPPELQETNFLRTQQRAAEHPQMVRFPAIVGIGAGSSLHEERVEGVDQHTRAGMCPILCTAPSKDSVQSSQANIHRL